MYIKFKYDIYIYIYIYIPKKTCYSIYQLVTKKSTNNNLYMIRIQVFSLRNNDIKTIKIY